MIPGDKSLGQTAEPGPTTIGQDGVIQQGTPSGPPHEGSRETYEGRIISVPRDYCWTPCGAGKVLIGYKIWAYQREATNLANTVLQTSLRSHVKGSIIKHCYGDDAGKLGGFTSGTHNAECTPKTWSQTVLWESRNAVRDSDEWWMNHFNTWGVLDYKKDTNQDSTEDPRQIEAKMYLAQYSGVARGAAAAGAAAAGAAAPAIARGAGAAGQYLSNSLPSKDDTVWSYLSRPYYNLTGQQQPAPSQPEPAPSIAEAQQHPPLTASLQQQLQNIVTITGNNPCPYLIARILAHMADLQTRRADLLADQHGLFGANHDIGISPYGSWNGHVSRYNSSVQGLQNAILMANAAGCKVPLGAYLYLTLATPSAPR